MPRWMARKAVATPRQILAISSETAAMSRAPPPMPAELLGDEEQLQADLGTEQLADGLFREGLVGVPLPQLLRRQHALPDLSEQIEHHFTFFDG